MSEDYQVMISRQILCHAIKCKIIISHIFCKIHISHILQIGQKTFSGANFRNMARMHNSTDYVTFFRKIVNAVFEKSVKNHISHILQIGQKTFLGANFRNMVRMHNSTDYVTFLEKSMASFLRKVSKTSFLGRF